ncbi:MAG TPA: NAD(P)H-binding protein [Gemmatimonadales bacterium]
MTDAATPHHRLLVLGATGPTGRQVVLQALEAGHTVTALARRPDRLALDHPRLRAVAADLAADEEAVSRVLPGHDAVISLLGRGQSLRSERLMARATPGIVSAMIRHGVRRLVYLSAFGVGRIPPEAGWIPRLMFRFLLRDIYADKAAGERIVAESGLDWTILAPVRLIDGPRTGGYRLGERLQVSGAVPIARADVAAAALRCVDDRATIRTRCVVAP